MPIYEFKCEECAAISSMSMKMSDPHPDTCPQCHKGPLKKIMSPTSFVLKGGGWYADAYTKTSSSSESSCTSKSSSNPACATCTSSAD
jgi:putative FmdB family regulatory protein